MSRQHRGIWSEKRRRVRGEKEMTKDFVAKMIGLGEKSEKLGETTYRFGKRGLKRKPKKKR
jgi:hypothetical protein